MNFFIKLRNFGYRRAAVYVIMMALAGLRVFFYRYIISENKPRLKSTKILQATEFAGKGRIQLGMSQIGFWPSPKFLSGSCFIEARSLGSIVSIGNSTFINNNCTIIADRTSIKIGDQCLIGPNFFIVDSDFHGIAVENRTNGVYEAHPVNIEDNVFIGEGVKVLKGVTIGKGAVIAAGSIVTHSIEAYSLCAGVPARKIFSLKENNGN